MIKYKLEDQKGVKRQKSNNKHKNGRANNNRGINHTQAPPSPPSPPSPPPPPQQLNNYTYNQLANEADLMYIVRNDLLPSRAFTRNQQPQDPWVNNTLPYSFDALLNDSSANQTVNIDFMNTQPYPLVPNTTSPTLATQSPLNHLIDPMTNDITTLSLNDTTIKFAGPTLNSVYMDPTTITEAPIIQAPTLPEFPSQGLPELPIRAPVEMPSRPDPPILQGGPSYVRASQNFIEWFKRIDKDGSGTISFDELKDSLYNKGRHKYKKFNDQAILTLIEMFDTSKCVCVGY